MKSSESYLTPWPAARQLVQARRLRQTVLCTGSDQRATDQAHALSRYLLCEDTGSLSCTCRSCRHALTDHPDFRQIDPGTQTAIGIDAVRELLSSIFLPPLWSAQRVIVIQQADRLRVEAGNALLKILEEPPPNLVFILTAPSASQVLPTIRSRCQVVGSPLLPEEHSAAFQQLFDEETFDVSRAVAAAQHVRRQLAGERKKEWLDALEILQQAVAQLESGSNPLMVQAVLRQKWPWTI
ncbi:MAG: hypothetical protein OWS74_04530 [Firmicutes bacterium]|nr:hypothetical protein [Bacillota bacterium]